MNVTEYQKQDDKGRAKAINLFGHQQPLVPSADPMAHFDLSGSTNNYNYFIEIKDRKYKSNDFFDDYLELNKLNNLRAIDTNPNTKFYYLNFFSNDVARLYNVTTLNIEQCEKVTKSCPKSSTENKGNTDKVMIKLPIKSAKKYRY